jgi:hypothetical protein
VTCVLLLAACFATLACGKYGPPVRGDRRDAPAETPGTSDEATP